MDIEHTFSVYKPILSEKKQQKKHEFQNTGLVVSCVPYESIMLRHTVEIPISAYT